jgi:ABC-type glycerol-3-phosphate transport system substrate-binding protein
MNGKRYLSLSLAALLLFGTGCSKEAASAQAASAEATARTEGQTTAAETSIAQQAETGIAPSDPETVHLTFAVSTDDMPGNYYTDIVTAFQEQNETIQIEFVDYGSDDTQLKLELAAGEGPDLLLPGENVGLLTSVDALVDLYGYLDQDPAVSREDFTNLNLLEESGKLTAVSPNYVINEYMGLQETYPAGFTWTTEEFLNRISAAASPQDITGNMTSQSFILDVLKSYIKNYVNYVDCTCDFETEEFESILRIATAINLSTDEPDVYDGATATYAELFSAYPEVIYPCTISGISGYSLLTQSLYGTPVTFVGLPTENGNGALASFVAELSICSYSANPDACWEFIKYCLTDDVTQKKAGLFPVLTSALEEQIQDAITEEKSTKVLDTQEILAAEVSGNYTVAVTEDEAEILRSLLYGGVSLSQYDDAITPIVTEEASACITGEKTPEETAALIQNRVEIYLGEHQ